MKKIFVLAGFLLGACVGGFAPSPATDTAVAPSETAPPPATDTPGAPATIVPASPARLPTLPLPSPLAGTPERPFPFVLRDSTITLAPYPNCDVVAVVGQPYALNGNPVAGLLVHLEGGGLAIDAITGSAPQYGPAGYEHVLDNPDISVVGEYWLWLVSPSGVILSDLVPVDVTGACDTNEMRIDFQQVKPYDLPATQCSPALDCAPTPEATPTSSTQRVHVVGAGETLGVIADRYYGRFEGYVYIAAVNDIFNPNIIEVGQELIIECGDPNWPCIDQ